VKLTSTGTRATLEITIGKTELTKRVVLRR